jgi:hypothetical protein
MIADMYRLTKSVDYPIRDIVSFQYKAVSGIEYFCDAMSRWIKIDRIVNDELLRQRDSGFINGSETLFVCFFSTAAVKMIRRVLKVMAGGGNMGFRIELAARVPFGIPSLAVEALDLVPDPS